MTNLYNSEIIAVLVSLMFLFPLSRNIIGNVIPYIFYPAFFVENSISDIFYLKMQRDELLRLKSEIRIIFPVDTLLAYPVRFKGYCHFSGWNSPNDPSFIKVLCDSVADEDDILWASGFVGYVVKSNGRFAEVQTLLSPEFYTMVVDKRSLVMGVMKGGSTPTIEFIPYGSDVKQGDTLYLKEHPGVYVGTVKFLILSPPFITIKVEPLWRYEVWTKFSLLRPLERF